MALIVEDGSGLVDAESYISVADADTYFLLRGEPKEWQQSLPSKKEAALRIATDAIDLYYSGKWLGNNKVLGQRLAWPRYGAYSRDVNSIDYGASIPGILRNATAELALRWIKDPQNVLGDVSSEKQNIVSESVTVGPISTSVTYAQSKSLVSKFPLIDMLLRQLTFGGGSRIIERG